MARSRGASGQLHAAPLSPEQRPQLVAPQADRARVTATDTLTHLSTVLGTMTATLLAARGLVLALRQCAEGDDSDRDTLTERDLPSDRSETV